MFYRTSLNPNPDDKDYISDDINNNTIVQTPESYLNINNYNSEDDKYSNPSSVFETDLKLQEAIINSEKVIISKGELEFTKDLQDRYKHEIIQALYRKDFKKAYDYSNEVIKNYNLNQESLKEYSIFLCEILDLKDYNKLGFQDKKTLISKMVSPEIILFMFLELSDNEQYSLLAYKRSHFIVGNPIYGANLTYKGHLTANLYSEMCLDKVFFIPPANVEGFKISFEFNGDNYRLYYIRHKKTNLIEIISIENITEKKSVTYEDYFSS
jgi:hypothetical protein